MPHDARISTAPALPTCWSISQRPSLQNSPALRQQARPTHTALACVAASGLLPRAARSGTCLPVPTSGRLGLCRDRLRRAAGVQGQGLRGGGTCVFERRLCGHGVVGYQPGDKHDRAVSGYDHVQHRHHWVEDFCRHQHAVCPCRPIPRSTVFFFSVDSAQARTAERTDLRGDGALLLLPLAPRPICCLAVDAASGVSRPGRAQPI